MKAARAIGMLTYRNYETFTEQQTDEEHHKLDNYRSSSYIHHQGDKLVKRFNAYSYWLISKAMDSHNIARERVDTPALKGAKVSSLLSGQAQIAEVLKRIKIRSLVIGISSDILCPPAEQKFLAKHLPKATVKIIDSSYGHDGFLTEWEKLTKAIASFLKR